MRVFVRPSGQLLAAVTLALASCAHGGISYTSGTAFYAHDRATGTSSEGAIVNASDSGIPTSSNLSSVGFTMNQNSVVMSGDATANSTGKGRIGYIANSTTVSIAMKTGTGVAQVDPTPAPTWNYSELKIDFRDATALRWLVTDTGGGFGPPASKYASFTVAGTVGTGAGAFARVDIDLAFYKNSISGGNKLADINLDTGTISTSGPFSKTLTSSGAYLQPVDIGNSILMIGTILFHANNDDNPTDIGVVDSAIGSHNGGNTGSFVGPAGNDDWLNILNWSSDSPDGNTTGGLAPRNIGDRAYIPATLNGGVRTLSLNNPSITLGALDVSAPTVLQASNPLNFITMQNTSPHAALVWLRNTAGEPQLTINAPVQHNSSTIYLNDSLNPIVMNGQLNGSPTVTIEKTGLGPMHINAHVAHTGPIHVAQGELQINQTVAGPGALVTVGNGGILSGGGNIQRPVQVSDGGAIAPGVGIGVLTTGDLFLDPSSQYSLQLDVDPLDGPPGTSADQIDVLGGVNLNNAVLAFQFVPGTPTPGPFTPQSFLIIKNDDAELTVGEFVDVPNNALVLAGLIEYSIEYNSSAVFGADGNDVVLTIHSVPEPASAALALLAIAAMRRRGPKR